MYGPKSREVDFVSESMQDDNNDHRPLVLCVCVKLYLMYDVKFHVSEALILWAPKAETFFK